MSNRFKHPLLVLTVLVMMFVAIPFQVSAAEGSDTYTKDEVNELTISYSGNTSDEANILSVESNSITLKTTAYVRLLGKVTNTMTYTFKNTSGGVLLLSFEHSGDVAPSGFTKVRGVDGVTRYTKTLAANATFTFTLTAERTVRGTDTKTVTLSNITTTRVLNNVSTTVTYDSNMGSVTYNSKAVTSGKAFTVLNSGKNLVATPKDGYSFLCWKDSAGNVVSYDATYQMYLSTDDPTAYVAEFVEGETPYFKIKSTGEMVRGLNEAIAKVGTTTDTIILVNSGTLAAGTYTIPANVTLLIPFDEAGTCYVETPLATFPSGTSPTPYRTLMLDSGAHIVVNGVMSVSSRVNSGSTSANSVSTAPRGRYGHVDMAEGSSITVNNGAKLSVYGYITGEGSVEALSGSNVYEGFQIADFRGGSATSTMANAKKVFPLSQYYVQNVMVPMTLHSGATE
ncbi:MAG: hypothetical protein IKM42_03490, partial [Clostridia bacterium]|nr:hypothetical protein [Clostridia bacterium]